MSPSAHVVPIVDSTSVFKPDIFKGKVLFCTGGGSGICRGMTEAMVSWSYYLLLRIVHATLTAHLDEAWCERSDCWTQVRVPIIHVNCFRRLTVKPRLDRLNQTAKELSEATGQECMAAQGDVRQPAAMKDAVAKTIAKFGRIDYVINGRFFSSCCCVFRLLNRNTGAAGNFLVPISEMSENAFKTVMEIDTVSLFRPLKSRGGCCCTCHSYFRRLEVSTQLKQLLLTSALRKERTFTLALLCTIAVSGHSSIRETKILMFRRHSLPSSRLRCESRCRCLVSCVGGWRRP